MMILTDKQWPPDAFFITHISKWPPYKKKSKKSTNIVILYLV